MIYTSLENDKIKNIKKLQEKKHRDKENLFLVEGEHLIIEAYNTGVLLDVYALESYKTTISTNINYCSEKVMKYLSSLDSYAKIIGICKKIEPKQEGNNIIALDNIQDPGNLGTIIRSAVAFNVDTILLSNTSVDLYNPKVVRATQGMIFKINVVVCDLVETLKSKKQQGYKIYGTDVNNGIPMNLVTETDKKIIILGNEGTGISNEVKSISDKNIYIKTNVECESLNVGVAASIIMYEMFGDK